MSDKLLYLHPHLQPDALRLEAMSDDELLSLAADGALDAQDDAAWARACAAPEAHSTWQAHLAIGEALRAQSQPMRGARSQSQWMAGLRTALAKETPHAQEPTQAEPALPATQAVHSAPAAATTSLPQPAANDRFWKLVAGGSTFTSIAAVAVAVGVTFRSQAPSVDMAAAPVSKGNVALVTNNRADAGQIVQTRVLTGNGQEVMLRDARMMEKMAQHRMFGAAGVHGSNAFVRNAAYEQKYCAPNAGTEC